MNRERLDRSNILRGRWRIEWNGDEGTDLMTPLIRSVMMKDSGVEFLDGAGDCHHLGADGVNGIRNRPRLVKDLNRLRIRVIGQLKRSLDPTSEFPVDASQQQNIRITKTLLCIYKEPTCRHSSHRAKLFIYSCTNRDFRFMVTFEYKWIHKKLPDHRLILLSLLLSLRYSNFGP